MAAKKSVTHSPQFEKYKKRYERGGCTREQLRTLVGMGVLTAAKYAEITGETYGQPEA